MGLVRILLPLPRAAAKWAPEKGGPLLGAALSYCVTPSWAGLPPPSPARRLAWAEEAVEVYRGTADTEGLSRALALRAHALLLSGRFAGTSCAQRTVPSSNPGGAVFTFMPGRRTR